MLAEAFAIHTEFRAGARACNTSLILNYAENVRRKRRAGILSNLRNQRDRTTQPRY